MQLPVPLTSFVGRAREVDALARLLESWRLVTLTGAGGSGKTRLAIETAWRVAERYPDGVSWIELAPLAEPALLVEHVADGLGLRAARTPRDPGELVDALRDRAMLVVLDNCEHLVDACAPLVELLLRRCPRLQVLATSREALGVEGERAWLVPVLSVPKAAEWATDAVRDAEAVRLFVERAQAVHPAFALTDDNAAAVVQICRRLDGLPLAIELAAARVRVLAPEQIAARLEEGFSLLSGGGRTALPRQRTLRGAIDWSFALLGEREQLLLQRLAVFAGGFTLEAVEAVCADDRIRVDEVLDVLSALVEKSLVMMELRAGEARYRLLEMVRQYGLELLRAGDGEVPLRERHAAFFLALAERLAPGTFFGGRDEAASARLDDELPNLRAAADWLEGEPARAAGALRLGWALHWHWFSRGLLREGRARLDAALARAANAPRRLRGRALVAAGSTAFWQGDVAATLAPISEGVAILRDDDEPYALAYALAKLGMAHIVTGDPHGGLRATSEGLSLARGIGDAALTVFALFWHGKAAEDAGDLAAAKAAYDEGEALSRRAGFRVGVAYLGVARGRIAYLEGDHAQAHARFGEGLAMLRDVRDRWGMVGVLDALAGIAASRGAHEQAARFVGASEALRERIGRVVVDAERADHARIMRAVCERLGEGSAEAAREAGRRLSEEEIAAEAERFAGCAAPLPGAAPTPASELLPLETGENGSAPLRVHALGPLEIWRDGELLPARAWSSAKARELLLFLLCHPDGCTREQVGLAFWPDASTAQVKNSFHVTLHHLRRALDRADWVVYEHERYRLPASLRVDFDAQRFEELVTPLRRGVRDAEGAARLEAGLALYRGDFLDAESIGDWHLEHRDRLQRLYVDGLVALADYLLRAERPADAAETYRRILGHDELHEGAHRGLMLCDALLGDRARALRHYERLASLLRTELDATPAPETTALFERLRRAEPL